MVSIQMEVDGYRGEVEGIHRNWMYTVIITISVIRVQTVFQAGIWSMIATITSVIVDRRQVIEEETRANADTASIVNIFELLRNPAFIELDGNNDDED